LAQSDTRTKPKSVGASCSARAAPGCSLRPSRPRSIDADATVPPAPPVFASVLAFVCEFQGASVGAVGGVPARTRTRGPTLAQSDTRTKPKSVGASCSARAAPGTSCSPCICVRTGVRLRVPRRECRCRRWCPRRGWRGARVNNKPTTMTARTRTRGPTLAQSDTRTKPKSVGASYATVPPAPPVFASVLAFVCEFQGASVGAVGGVRE
jgi:hypothetical protein